MSFQRYPKYKPSGVEWLGDVPAHWTICALNYRYEIALGKMLDEKRITGKHLAPYLRNTDVQWSRINVDDLPQMDFSGNDIERYGLRRGDLLVCEGGEVGRAAIWDATLAECYYQKAIHRIRARNEDRDSARFLCSLFRVASSLGVFTGAEGKSTIAHLTAEALRRYRMPFPSLAEQTRIAEFLDRETAKIDELVAEQRRLMELLKEKRQAVISHAVTRGLNPKAPLKPSGIEWLGDVPTHWDVKQLGYLCSKIGSGKTPLGGAEAYINEGILFIRSQNVYDEGLFLDDVVFVTEVTDAEQPWSRVLPGDILLNITGASLGRTCLVPAEFAQANVNQHVCILRLFDPAQREYVALVLKSSWMKAQFDSAQTGAAREGLNFSQISKLVLAVPPTGEQTKITDFLHLRTAEFDTLTAEAQRAIDLLQERRTALISAAVTGQIDVRAALSP